MLIHETKEIFHKTYFHEQCSPIKTKSESFGSHQPNKYVNKLVQGPAQKPLCDRIDSMKYGVTFVW